MLSYREMQQSVPRGPPIAGGRTVVGRAAGLEQDVVGHAPGGVQRPGRVGRRALCDLRTVGRRPGQVAVIATKRGVVASQPVVGPGRDVGA